MVRRLVTLGLLAFSFAPLNAAAYHTEDDRQSDFSAHTLRRNQLRLGLFQQEYGILNSWMVGTYTAPWVIMPIAKAPNFDLYTKVKFIDLNGWAAAARVTFFYFDVSHLAAEGLEDGDFRAIVVPWSLMFSRVFDERWTATFETTWTQSTITADVEASGDSTLLGATAQSNLQFALNGEMRLSKVTALNLVARYVPFATDPRIKGDTQVDGATQASFDAEFSSEDIVHSWLIQPGVTFSWQLFNLQLGVGYGDVFVPGLGIVAPTKFVQPDMDAYFRF